MIAIPMPDFWWPLVRVWRNHPTNRPGFGTDHAITIDEHRAWMRTLDDRNRQYMVLNEAWPIGTFGLQWMDVITVEATRICLDPDLHRQGYGVPLCELAANRAKEDFGAHCLCLRVLKTNTAAYRCYLKAGFVDEPVPPTPLDGAYIWMERMLQCH